MLTTKMGRLGEFKISEVNAWAKLGSVAENKCGKALCVI